jgi:hypothetical protein
MKKFIWKSGIFLLGLVLLIYILGFVGDSLAPLESPLILQELQQHTRLLQSNTPEVTALVIGNSHGGSIDLQALGHQGFNLNRGFADAFENHYYIEQFVSHYPGVQVVFIPVSYFLPHWDNGASVDLSILRTYLYTALPFRYPLQGDWATFLTVKGHSLVPIKSITRWDSWKGALVALTGKQVTATSENGKQEDTLAQKCTGSNLQALHEHAQVRVAESINFSQEMTEKHPQLDRDVLDQLIETITYLQARGIRVVFFTPPYFETYRELSMLRGAETVAQTEEMMTNLQQKYGVEYYDFSQDAQFASNPQLFFDSDHLNACGAALFTTQLKNRLLQSATSFIKAE